LGGKRENAEVKWSERCYGCEFWEDEPDYPSPWMQCKCVRDNGYEFDAGSTLNLEIENVDGRLTYKNVSGDILDANDPATRAGSTDQH
jgi:hypothetical protein